MNVKIKDIVIRSEFRNFNSPLTEEELRGLRDNIIADGMFIDTIKVWMDGQTPVLIDGHHRRDIWRSLPPGHSISPPKITVLDLPDRDSVFVWMINHQAGRRNQTDLQRD